MTREARSYSLKNIKETVTVKKSQVMAINIKYPLFEKCGSGKKEEAFIAKINKFYARTAESYIRYILEKYPKRAAKIYESNGNVKLSFLMDCTVSYNSEDILSAFCDLSYFDGKKKKTVRFSQNWSSEKSAILPAALCFDTSRRSKRHITDLIAEIADANIKSRSFAYFSGYESIIRRKFDFESFYFVPKGTAFFYNEGVLSADEGPCIFVLPNERIDGILRIQ